MDVVRDHRAETLLRCELRERVAQRGIVGIEVIGELDVAALAEDRGQPGERLARRVEVARADRARHRPVGAASKREEPRGVLADERERRARLGLLARELRRRDDPAEARPALTIAGDDDEVPGVQQVQLGAVERLEAALLRRVREPHRAVEAVRVGEGERVHARVGRRVDEVAHV